LNHEGIADKESRTFIAMNTGNEFLIRLLHTSREELNLTKPAVMNPLHKLCEQVVNNPVETIVADACKGREVQLAY
jgi:hypothetical protein